MSDIDIAKLRERERELLDDNERLRAELDEVRAENERLAVLVRGKDADSTWTAKEAADETAERIAAWLAATQGAAMQLAPANVVDDIRAGKWRDAIDSKEQSK